MLIMTIGLPKSGKTTYTEELEEYGFSSYFTPADTEATILNALRNGENVIIDGSNLIRSRRVKLLKYLKGNNIETKMKCVLFVAPLNLLEERAADKFERTYGCEIGDVEAIETRDFILRCLKRFDPPFIYEGWDEIEIKWSTNMADIKLPDDLMEFNQDLPYTKLSLGQHMKKTYEIIKDKTLNDPSSSLYNVSEEMIAAAPAVWIAAYMHDIGKSLTKIRLDENDGLERPETRYDGYQHAGAYLYLNHINNILLKQNAIERYGKVRSRDIERAMNIANMIAFQDAPNTEWTSKKEAFDSLTWRYDETNAFSAAEKAYCKIFIDDVYLLNECEKLAK